MGRRPNSAIFIVLFATSIWATSGILISWILDWSGISPVNLAFWRDLATFACLLLGIILLKPALLRVNRRDIPWFIAMGVISVGFLHVIWTINILWNGAALATVFQANAPIFVTIIAWLIWRESLSMRKVGAITLALIGTALVARLDTHGTIRLSIMGLVIGLTSALSYGLYSIFGKKLGGTYNPWTVLVYSFGFATLVLFPFQIGSSLLKTITLPVLLSFAALVLFPTLLGYGLYTIGLGRLPASTAAIVATAEIPFAAIYAYFALGERLTSWQILGAILIVGGVILVSLPLRSS